MNPPDYAVTVWLDGTDIVCQFPDRHTVRFEHINQFLTVLKFGRDQSDRRVGTEASPVQYDIDAVADALARQAHSAEWDKRVAEAGARRRERDEQVKVRRLKRDSREMEQHRARKLMEAAGL
jgi:hypothetical protein